MTGALGDGTLSLSVQPLRIDWLYTPPLPSIDSLPPVFKDTIGPFATVVEPFVTILDRWFAQPDCPEIMRLAYGPVLLDPAESRQEGYRRIGTLLPAVTLDGDNSSDFSYQINRPRMSNVVRGLAINRVSKWGVSAFQSIVANDAGITVADKRFALRLEMDINSSAEHAGALPTGERANLLHEFVNLAAEIGERGDIP